MPALVSSLEGTIKLAASQLGVSWPNPWWPKGSPLFNDCAAFVSWCLWGLNGTAPFHTVVSDVIERSGLEFHAGNNGIRRGDLLGLRWTTTVNYDHIGIALGPPNAQGVVQTIDANGGSNKVAYSNRRLVDVHNFARPNYPTTSTAGTGSTPLNVTPKEPEMFIVDASKLQNYRNGVWLMAPGYIHGFTPAEWNDWGQNLQAAGVWVFTPPTDAGFDSLMASLTVDRRPFPGAGTAGLPTGAASAPAFDQAALTVSLTKAVTDAIAASPEPTAATIASAVDAALADNFAAIPTAGQNGAAVVKAEGAALSNG